MSNRKILLRFGTQNLDKARQALKQIKALSRESIKSIKDVGKRREAREAARKQDLQDREILREARDRQRGDRRSRGIRRGARKGFVSPLKGLNGEAFLGGPQGLLSNVLGQIPGFAPALAGATALISIVKPIVEQEFAALEREKLNKLQARIEKLEAESVARRLKEDVVFQARVGGEAAAANRALLRAQATKRVLKSSRLSQLSELG